MPTPVGADNAVTSCGLRILVDQAAELVASSDADVVVCGRDGDLAIGWKNRVSTIIWLSWKDCVTAKVEI